MSGGQAGSVSSGSSERLLLSVKGADKKDGSVTFWLSHIHSGVCQPEGDTATNTPQLYTCRAVAYTVLLGVGMQSQGEWAEETRSQWKVVV